jgi:catechol 2,3-dioxygenase-like lactoylglutathione lyase family enzyme
MNVRHLRYVAIAAPEFERSRAFFAQAWGLRDTGDASGGAAFFQTQSSEAFQLALVAGPQRKVERIAFALATRADVDDAARELDRAGVPIVAAPQALDTPGQGYGVRFLDPENRCIELSADVAEGTRGAHGATPLKLAHVVLNTTDIECLTSFYTGVLGFRVSDWSENLMAFLRCNREHHSLAFNVAPHAAYNHTSWSMESIDALFRAQGRIRGWGSPLMWGTGRHGPGAQVFNYFIEPSGYVTELIADGIEIDAEDTWQPTVWARKPEFMDLWGTAGPPSAELRAAMSGVPDPGYAVERV